MNATVFVVDDDPGVRGLLAAEIEAAGYQARAYASAEDFLANFGVVQIEVVLGDRV